MNGCICELNGGRERRSALFRNCCEAMPTEELCYAGCAERIFLATAALFGGAK